MDTNIGQVNNQATNRTTNARRGRARRVTIRIIVVFLVVLAAGLVTLISTLDRITTLPIKGRTANVLLLGTDVTYDVDGGRLGTGARADTIILACLDTKNDRAHLISIPRDTRVEIPGYGIGKINAAHAYGGPKLVMETVSGLVGVSVDYYIETDFRGFKDLVDLVGGVDLEVEKDLHYVDRAGNLRIDLNRGLQHLDGEQALQYARFRMDALGDIGRVARQQRLMKAVMERFQGVRGLTLARKALEVARERVKTNMSTSEMLALARYAMQLGSDKLETTTLPGSFSPIYWMPDSAGIQDLVEHMSIASGGNEDGGNVADGNRGS